MGSVRKLLSSVELPEREKHHSRMFIDLAENIHIHHREYRTVFSLDEYFEYVDVIARSTEDVRSFLATNQNYKEQEFPTTIMVGGGRAQQLKYLSNSPAPNRSAYFDNEMAVELQDEFVTDEIHIHYRDFRISMDRIRFKLFADCVQNAATELDNFLEHNEYERTFHADRIVDDFNRNTQKSEDSPTFVNQGIKEISLENIRSNWYLDIVREFTPPDQFIKPLVEQLKTGGKMAPILVCNGDAPGSYVLVDGHHRLKAHYLAQKPTIDAVILDLEYDATEKLRSAEALLKEFDAATGYKYKTSSYLKSYLGYCLNRYYSSMYNRKLFRNTLLFRGLRLIKHLLFGKKTVFKSFNEAFNKT